jgi:hypothetical protein
LNWQFLDEIMAQAIEQIEESLAVLEGAIARLSIEFHHSYSNYLTNLGKAVRQQLILASYHLCTQGNPTGFLNLSLGEKQKLQQDIRQLGGQIQEKLLAQLLPENDSELAAEVANGDGEELFRTEEKAEFPREVNPQNPESLAQWQEELEKKIGQTLKNCSRDANRLLQQAGILPQQMPEALLEAALKADNGHEVPGPPNLLNLMVEARNDREPENSTFIQLIAIQLRLAEIELADGAVMTGRHQIRHLVSQLSRMRREYQKKQREKAIAEAESAWRAIWVDQ